MYKSQAMHLLNRDNEKAEEQRMRLDNLRKLRAEFEQMVPPAGLGNVDKKPPSDHRFDEGMRRRLSPVKDFSK